MNIQRKDKKEKITSDKYNVIGTYCFIYADELSSKYLVESQEPDRSRRDSTLKSLLSQSTLIFFFRGPEHN